MWKHRQVVGVGKGQGWGTWGEAQEARGGLCVSMWAGVISLGDGWQMGGLPGRGLAGEKQGPGWENKTWDRYLGQKPGHGGVR